MSFLVAVGVAGAGALGTLCRYGTDQWVRRHFQAATQALPGLGILVVNVLGGAAAGLAFATLHSFPTALVIILSGFLGAFTTFSTAMLDTFLLLADKHWWKALTLLAATFILTLLVTWATFLLGTSWIS